MTFVRRVVPHLLHQLPTLLALLMLTSVKTTEWRFQLGVSLL
jgi:hypothetical protein